MKTKSESRILVNIQDIERFSKQYCWMKLLAAKGKLFVATELKKYEFLQVPAPILNIKRKCDNYKFWNI